MNAVTDVSNSPWWIVLLCVLPGVSSLVLHAVAPAWKVTALVDQIRTLLADHRNEMKLLSTPTVFLQDADPAPARAATSTTVTTMEITKPIPRLPQSGRVTRELAAIVTVGLLSVGLPGLLVASGCQHIKDDGTLIKDDAIACAKADQSAIATAVAQLAAQALGQALGLGHIDTTQLAITAIGQGEIIGGCAADKFVAQLEQVPPAAPGSTPPAAAPRVASSASVAPSTAQDARALREQVRAHFGGRVTWVWSAPAP